MLSEPSRKVPLKGMKILVIEDAFLVAIDICACLESCGCEIAGPVGRLEPALALARSESLAAAVVDVDLAGELTFPVAKTLTARQVPFVFITGYDDDFGFPEEFRHVPRLSKPFDHSTLSDYLVQSITRIPRLALVQ
jgi:DNA-binding NarL/FixJ family response regulator